MVRGPAVSLGHLASGLFLSGVARAGLVSGGSVDFGPVTD